MKRSSDNTCGLLCSLHRAQCLSPWSCVSMLFGCHQVTLCSKRVPRLRQPCHLLVDAWDAAAGDVVCRFLCGCVCSSGYIPRCGITRPSGNHLILGRRAKLFLQKARTVRGRHRHRRCPDLVFSPSTVLVAGTTCFDFISLVTASFSVGCLAIRESLEKYLSESFPVFDSGFLSFYLLLFQGTRSPFVPSAWAPRGRRGSQRLQWPGQF